MTHIGRNRAMDSLTRYRLTGTALRLKRPPEGDTWNSLYVQRKTPPLNKSGVLIYERRGSVLQDISTLIMLR